MVIPYEAMQIQYELRRLIYLMHSYTHHIHPQAWLILGAKFHSITLLLRTKIVCFPVLYTVC